MVRLSRPLQQSCAVRRRCCTTHGLHICFFLSVCMPSCLVRRLCQSICLSPCAGCGQSTGRRSGTTQLTGQLGTLPCYLGTNCELVGCWCFTSSHLWYGDLQTMLILKVKLSFSNTSCSRPQSSNSTLNLSQ